MSIEDAIYSRASGYAGLSALVGDKISPGLAHQSDGAPYITYHLINNTRPPAMVSDTGIVRASYQFSAFASTKQEVIDILNQVRLCFQRWSGTESSVTVQQCFIENESDVDYELDTQLHHRYIDIEFIYEE